MSLAGCAQVTSSSPPVELTTVAPLGDTINAGPVGPRLASTPEHDGRPAPFAARGPSTPRPRAPRPEPTSVVVSTPSDTAVRPTSAIDPAPSASPAPLPPAATRDQVVQESLDSGDAKAPEPLPGRDLGAVVARVGDVSITFQELQLAVQDFKRANLPDDQRLSPADESSLAKLVLEKLINRTLLVEEARRAMKSPKQWETFEKFADGQWDQEELPPLLKKYGAIHKNDLDAKLAARGESLEHLRESYRRESIAQQYLMMKLAPRFKPSLPEMQAYYRDHVQVFDRPAQVTWREVVIKIDDQTDRAAALRKAEAIRARLGQGDDFARLAQAESQGPTADQGGLQETEPDSHTAPSVNQALSTLPPGQVSAVLDCPDGFRVLRVESRRPAGPAEFASVQEKVARALFEENYEREVRAYLTKLRERNVIRTIRFDGPGG